MVTAPDAATVYDAIIVGSGITGGWAAKELTQKGLRVLVLERGRMVRHVTGYTGEHTKPWNFRYGGKPDRALDESDYPIQSTTYNFDETTRQFFINDRLNPYSHAEGRPFVWVRGDQVGGRSLTWGRQTYRWSDLDFEANARDGHGVDWPIRYADIEPWYDHVERVVGVSGQAEGLVHLPDGVFQKPMEWYAIEKTIGARLHERMPELRMTIGRCAVLTERLGERAPCHYCGPCARGCSTASTFSSQAVTLPAAEATGRLTLRPDSAVRRLIYDAERNRIEGVEAVDALSGKTEIFRSRIVFLCASTAASIQILLNSRSEAFPDGLANSSGLVGRYVTDHPHGMPFIGLFTDDLDRYHRGYRPNGLYIPRFRNLTPGAGENEHGFLRGYGYQADTRRMDWRYLFNLRGVGRSYKELLRQPAAWVWALVAFGEALPRRDNRITLDSTRIDHFGMPLVHFDVSWTENEQHMWRDMVERTETIYKAAGASLIVPQQDELDPPGYTIHEMGGAVMGKDPKGSVLNGWNQSHDIPNLFITDGAAMASSSCVNPSLTYMALTARAADHAARLFHKGFI